jgi:Reverse transcriptase (RNA-dependent DNA polymerase)
MPEWVINMVQSFLKGRRTHIAFPGYGSGWIETVADIPQGSLLSPISFIFFITKLLEEFQQAGSEVLAFGFVDDTSLVA